MKITLVLTVLVTGLVAPSANAGVAFNPIVISSSPLPGFVTNRVTISTTTKLLATVLFIPLTSGTFSNVSEVVDPFPSDLDLNDFSSILPGDSFWTINNDPDTVIAGAAGDLGHLSGVAEFLDGGTVVGIAIGQAGPFDNHVGPGLLLGDLTFSSSANGVGGMLISTNPSVNAFDVFVTNGVVSIVPVPEPGSLAVMGLGGLTVLRRRR